jgi:hypothetical protein
VVIDPEGRLTLEPGAQRRLAPRPGRFRVLPTTGDIIILQKLSDPNSNSSVTPGPPGRVTLAGEIEPTGGLVDVINFINTNQWSGQLALIEGLVRKTLYFSRGDVRTAASNVAEDRLGAILYRYGVVSEADLNAALPAVGGGTRIGQLLVERGALTVHELYTYVRRQVEEIFFSVLMLRKGAFYFYRTAQDQGPPSQLLLPTRQLLFDGVRRIDELSYFREKLPSVEMVLERRHPAPLQKLEELEERVLQLVDGKRDIRVIARMTHLGEFETTKVLYRLLTSSFVEASQKKSLPKMRPGDSIEDLYGTIVDAFNAVYGKIYTAVKQRGREQALHKGLESFFSSVAEFSPLFVGITLDGQGMLPRSPLLANLHMAPSPDRLDYLYRGLNELLFFELFTAGEAVDRREEIELHQRLNQILRDRPGRTINMVAEPEEGTPEGGTPEGGTPEGGTPEGGTIDG